ncbi:MAG: hypothetical protein QXN66_06780 [Thermoplasmatales archaeon]
MQERVMGRKGVSRVPLLASLFMPVSLESSMDIFNKLISIFVSNLKVESLPCLGACKYAMIQEYETNASGYIESLPRGE